MDDHKAIGARIRLARKAKGLTQVDLAAAIGVARSHLTNAERGHGGLALDKLSLLASEAGTSVAWLIGETGADDQRRADLLAAFDGMADLDRETLLRVAQSLSRSPRERSPPLPFPERGGVIKNLVSADRGEIVPFRRLLPAWPPGNVILSDPQAS